MKGREKKLGGIDNMSLFGLASKHLRINCLQVFASKNLQRDYKEIHAISLQTKAIAKHYVIQSCKEASRIVHYRSWLQTNQLAKAL